MSDDDDACFADDSACCLLPVCLCRELCCLCACWVVLWILLYGYVIFPHFATEKNTMLGCHTERHYNEQTETYENIEVCELIKAQVWLWAVPAGVASAYFSAVLSCGQAPWGIPPRSNVRVDPRFVNRESVGYRNNWIP